MILFLCFMWLNMKLAKTNEDNIELDVIETDYELKRYSRGWGTVRAAFYYRWNKK